MWQGARTSVWGPDSSEEGRGAGELSLAKVRVYSLPAYAVLAGEDGFRTSVGCPLDQLSRHIRWERLLPPLVSAALLGPGDAFPLPIGEQSVVGFLRDCGGLLPHQRFASLGCPWRHRFASGTSYPPACWLSDRDSHDGVPVVSEKSSADAPRPIHGSPCPTRRTTQQPGPSLPGMCCGTNANVASKARKRGSGNTGAPDVA